MTPAERLAKNASPNWKPLSLVSRSRLLRWWRVRELEGRLAKDCLNSSKPPATDELRRKAKSLRQQSGKRAVKSREGNWGIAA